MPLLFIDLETTGLDPATCAVLEVAAIVVPDTLELNDAAPRFHAVLAYDTAGCKFLDPVDPVDPVVVDMRKFLDPVDPVVVDMHTKNGLWAECDESSNTVQAVDAALRAFITTHCSGAQLAGNSVHFDRAFMSVHLSRSLAALHYRQVDVSSLNELARRVWPDVYAARPKADDKPHRAMPDVINSIAQARHYASVLAPRPAYPDGSR